MNVKLYKLADVLIDRATELKNETLKNQHPEKLAEQIEVMMKLTESKTLSEVALVIQKIL